MLNLRKSKLLVVACDLLGHWVTSATIALNLKYESFYKLTDGKGF